MSERLNVPSWKGGEMKIFGSSNLPLCAKDKQTENRMKNYKPGAKRKPFFSGVKKGLRLFIKKPRIVNLNENKELEDGSIYLCNHVGARGPLKLELYFPKDFRFWGTYEMCFGFKQTWSYLAYTYYHKKHHSPKWWARIQASYSIPFTKTFYKGMNLIPTYPDTRMKSTIETSAEILDKGRSIVIFPEDSSDGYKDVLTKYFAGFFVLAKYVLNKYKKNLKIYNMYFRKKDNTIIIDKYKTAQELVDQKISNKDIAEQFRVRANEIANLELNLVK